MGQDMEVETVNALAKPKAPVECKEYRLWVASLPSVESKLRPCVAHHRIGGRHSQSKTDDWECFALTDAEHRRLHDHGWNEWEARCGTEAYHVARTLELALSLGLIAPTEDGYSFNRKALKRAVDY